MAAARNLPTLSNLAESYFSTDSQTLRQTDEAGQVSSRFRIYRGNIGFKACRL